MEETGTSPVGVVTHKKRVKPKETLDGTEKGGIEASEDITGAKKDSPAMTTEGQNEGALGGKGKGQRAGEEKDAAVSETSNGNPGAIKDRTTNAAKGETEQTSGRSGSGHGAGRRGGGRGGTTRGGMGKLRVNIRGGGGPQEAQGRRDTTPASVVKPAETGCSDVTSKAGEGQQQARMDQCDSTSCGAHHRDAQQEDTSEAITTISGRSYDPMHSESNPIYVQQEDWRPYTEETRNSSMVLGKREGHTGQREANYDEEGARKTATWRKHRMEGLSNESQQNEERTKTATVDREAGHGTGLGSQPRRPHMANSGGWGSRLEERGARSPPKADQDADRVDPGSGWGRGSGETLRRLGGQQAQNVEMEEEEHKAGNGEGAAGAEARGWGSAKETYAHDRLDPGGWTSSWTGWEPEEKEVEMDTGEKSDDTMDGTKKYVAGLPVGWGADIAEQTLRPRSPPGGGWGAGRGWGDSSPREENTGGSLETARVATPKPKEEDEEESQRACELINDLVEAEEKENQDGSQWAEDQGFTIRDANNQFMGCFSAWNNGEQCGEFSETKCKRHKQEGGAIGAGSAICTTADKTSGLVHKGNREGSIAMKGTLQSRDITEQLTGGTRETEINQDEDGATVTTAGKKKAEFGGVNDESLRNEDMTEVILFKEGGFEPD